MMRALTVILLLLFGADGVQGQTVLSRQVIGSAGTNSVATSNNTTFSQTVGETVVGTGNGTTVELTQGFQQPELFFVLPTTLNYFNAFTPDGDGKNDAWVIPDLSFYPNNSVTILNRYGDKIQSFENYDNTTVVWDGTSKSGEMLPSGTYFFVIEYTTETSRKGQSGWVHMSY